MPAPSTPPPSQSSNDKSGGGLYFVGAVGLIVAAFGLYIWKKPAEAPVTPQATTATQTAAPEPPAPLYAPPPPPKIEDLPDAGSDAAAPAPAKTGTGAVGSLGPCGNCTTGQASPALTGALRGVAGSAQGCYKRALRTSEVSGSLTVTVQVGSNGQVCSASINNDSVHSGEISSCVLGRFHGQSFPPPSGGCVTVNIPISFTIKN